MKELTHGLFCHLLQLGRGCEDCCKLVNIFLQHCTIIENDDGDLKGSDNDKCDFGSPETCAHWNESLEGKLARRANLLGWPERPGGEIVLYTRAAAQDTGWLF